MKRITPALLALATITLFTGCGTAHLGALDSANSVSMVPGTVTQALEQNRMLIWRATLSLEVASVSNATTRVTDIAKRSGGYVQSKSDMGKERARMTIRVPAASLTSAMGSLESIGEVLHRQMSSEDVTEQYVDTDARLKTMVALRDRMRALLEKAKDVKDILAIEKELGRVQADIDSMQARLKALKGNVDFATINLSIEERHVRILGPLGYALKGAWWAVEKLFVIRK